MSEGSERAGVWLVGARGSVAVTAMTGAAAIKAGIAPPAGCVTELPQFQGCGLPEFDDLVFGGHDLADTWLPKQAERLVQAGVIPRPILDHVRDELADIDTNIIPGIPNPPTGQRELADRIGADLAEFRARHNLSTVVVVHVASTEPRPAPNPAFESLANLERSLAAGEDPLPASSLYAYAALRAGCGYIDFTPSQGARLPALDELANTVGQPYAGSDAKTGETLLRTTLAPLFTTRALRVRSWSGTNLLGGGDGATLAEPQANASKTTSKNRCLSDLLGYLPEGHTHIDYVPTMGQWKTAWDHILFDGFLGTSMTMQFTWQGCDSTLAAPLLLDLVRLMARAQRAGQAGELPQLGFFFKDPVGSTDHNLTNQFNTLCSWVASFNDQ